jgi:hypothetical protein
LLHQGSCLNIISFHTVKFFPFPLEVQPLVVSPECPQHTEKPQLVISLPQIIFHTFHKF